MFLHASHPSQLATNTGPPFRAISERLANLLTLAGALVVISLLSEAVLVPMRMDPGQRLILLGLGSIAALATALALCFQPRVVLKGLASTACLLLFSLAVLSSAQALLTPTPAELEALYPWVFRTNVIAMSVLAVGWNALFEHLERRHPSRSADRHLRDSCRSLVFLLASLAAVCGWMLAAWPRIEGIGIADDSFEQVLWSVVAYLGAVGCALRLHRRTTRRAYGLLALVNGAALVACIVQRALPYAHIVH